MRRAIALAALLVPALALAFSVPPPPSHFVHDGANILRGGDLGRIENRLMQLNNEGLQIGVVTMPSLDGESVEDATLRIAEAWGPGQRRQDNGVLIAVFMAERKMRIEVGYGLEGRIPDSTARQIVSDQLRPAFRGGRFGDGIMNAIDSVAAAATGRSMPRQAVPSVALPGTSYRFRPDNPLNMGGCGCLCWLFIAFFILRVILRSIFRPRHYGFGPQATYAPRMPWWSWMLFGSAMGRATHHHRHRSGWSWGGGSGSGWGGGGGGGSFGGGSFGGGGASGSW